MATPKLIARDSGGTPIAAALEFTDVVPGIASSAIEFQIFNDNTTLPRDTAQDPVVFVTQVDDTTGDPVSTGLRAINEGWLEVRALGGGSSGSTQPTTAWFPMTGQTRLRLEPLPEGEYHSMEIRYAPPGSAAETDITFFANADNLTRQQFIGLGHTESYRDGVLTGTGESNQTYLWFQGAQGAEQVPTENTVPDADIILPDLGWHYKGVPYFQLTENLTFDNLDGSAVALAAGEEYWATVSLGAGVVTVYKSDKATAPIATSERVGVDENEVILAYVRVDDTLTINNADITGVARARRFELLDLSSLTITIGSGRAIVNNSLVETQVTTSLTLTDDDVNYIWLQSSDTIFAVTTDDEAPSQNAYKIYEITAAGGVITDFEDLRQELGGQVLPVQFFFDGEPTDADTAYAVLPAHRDCYLLGERPMILRTLDAGSGTSQGETVVDVEIDDGAGSWTTLFTSSATDDRRPGFAWDDTIFKDEGALPEIYAIPAGSLIRARLDEQTAWDGTPPRNWSMVMFVEVP